MKSRELIYSDNFETLNKNVWECSSADCSVSDGAITLKPGHLHNIKYDLSLFKEFEIEFELYNPTDNRITFGIGNQTELFIYLMQDVSYSSIRSFDEILYDLPYNVYLLVKWRTLKLALIHNQYRFDIDGIVIYCPKNDDESKYFQIGKWYDDYLKVRNFKLYQILTKPFTCHCNNLQHIIILFLPFCLL